MTTIKVEFTRSHLWKYIEPIVPALNALPQWYKDKKREETNALPMDASTIKACPGVFDSMTHGYMLPLWVDLYIEPSGEFINGISVPKFHWNQDIRGGNDVPLMVMFTLEATEGMPGADKINLPAFKLNSPWILKTPKGYSTLFIAPLNNRDIMFEAISGIVHTDVYSTFINIPLLWTGPPDFKGIIKKGTPMVQMIPFKREEFEYELGFTSPEEDAEQLACVHAMYTGFGSVYKQKFSQDMKFE